MDTIQSYLGGEIQISTISLLKFWEKVGEWREKWCDRREREKKKVWWCGCRNMCSIFQLPEKEEREEKEKKRNCGNGIAKIGGEKREEKKNCGNSSAEIDGERRERKKKIE